MLGWNRIQTMGFVNGPCLFPVVQSPQNKLKCSKRIPAYRTFPKMALRAVENFDGGFELAESVSSVLNAHLLDSSFAKLVAEQSGRDSAEYMGLLFQPVPYSAATPHGMPKEMEKYYNDPNFAIINIPPTLMFKAKCAKPSRLCAVFRLQGEARECRTDERLKGPLKTMDWGPVGDAFRNPVNIDEEDDLDLQIV